jgi:hypothetical protein
VLIHQFDEPLVVCRLKQMNQFMHNDVLKAFPWFFGKIGVQQNGLGGGIAATPFGLHAANSGLFEFKPTFCCSVMRNHSIRTMNTPQKCILSRLL